MCEGMLENHLLTEEVKVMKVCLGLWGYVGEPLVDRGSEGDEGMLRCVRVCWRTTC